MTVPPISPRNLAAIYRAERGPSWSVDTDPLRQPFRYETIAMLVIVVGLFLFAACVR
jgi:hypothetical protein